MRKLPYVLHAEQSGPFINITVKEKKGVFFKLSDFFQRKHLQVIEIKSKEPTLEDVFIHLTKKDIRD